MISGFLGDPPADTAGSAPQFRGGKTTYDARYLSKRVRISAAVNIVSVSDVLIRCQQIQFGNAWLFPFQFSGERKTLSFAGVSLQNSADDVITMVW